MNDDKIAQTVDEIERELSHDDPAFVRRVGRLERRDDTIVLSVFALLAAAPSCWSWAWRHSRGPRALLPLWPSSAASRSTSVTSAASGGLPSRRTCRQPRQAVRCLAVSSTWRNTDDLRPWRRAVGWRTLVPWKRPASSLASTGSDTAQEALRWAVGLGETLGAEVVAVHAVGLLEELHDRDVAEDSWRAGLRDLVERTWCAPLARARCGHRVELRHGHPVDVLLGLADDEHAALIVVGSRGVGANPALALGSTSLRVLQGARVPVLVVPDGGRPAASARGLELRRLLVGVDRSEASLVALELASDVAGLLGGSLSVLEVI